MKPASRVFFVAVVLALVAVQVIGIAAALPWGLGADEPTHLQYAGFLAETGRLPDPAVDDVYQAQHPPLYHGVLGVLWSLARRGSDVPENDGQAWVLPYERRVVLRPDRVLPDPVARDVARALKPGVEPDPADLGRISEGSLYGLRLSGLAFALLAAFLTLVGVRRGLPDTPRLALLAAACGLLVPQFSATFATANNDQFAILFATAAWAVLLGAIRDGREPALRPLLLASLLFGLGFLSKLLILGAFVGAAVLLLLVGPATLGQRLKNLLLLGTGPLLLAGWWVVRQVAATGSLHALTLAAERHPEYLRVGRLELSASIDLFGNFPASWLAGVGEHQLHPGALWRFAALALPLTLVAGLIVVLGTRRRPTRERSLVIAFVAALITQLATTAYGNRDFIHVHGRYFQSLVLPGSLALAIGASHLFGPQRARPALALLAVLVASGGPLLLHGKLLPTYHAGHAIQTVPDVVAYADLGTVDETVRWRDPAVRIGHGVPLDRQRGYYPRPQHRQNITDSVERPVEVSFRGLDAQAMYLVSVRFTPPGDRLIADHVSQVDLLADGAQISGPLSMHAQSEWISFAVPRSATQDGEFTLYVRLLTGLYGGLSEVLLRRLPLGFDGTSELGDALTAAFTMEDPQRLGVAYLSLLGEGAPLQGPVPLRHAAADRMEARFTLGADAPARLEVALTLPDSLWADVKLHPYAPHREVLGRRRLGSPGLFVLALDPERAKGKGIAAIPAAYFPPGPYRMRFLDPAGKVITEGLRLKTPTGVVTADPEGSFLVESAASWTSSGRLEVLFDGDEPLEVDRLQATTARPWIYGVPRR